MVISGPQAIHLTMNVNNRMRPLNTKFKLCQTLIEKGKKINKSTLQTK